MNKNVLPTVVLLCVFVAPVFTQTKKNTKSLTASAFVAAESRKSPALKRPAEETFGIWNEFGSENLGFTIVFPAKSEEIRETGQGKIAGFETETEKAHYGVLRMKFPPLLDRRQLNILRESLFARGYDAKTTKLISEKNICLDGMAGKELIYEESGKIFFTRFYIMEQDMFMLSVSLPKTQYTVDFDYWAMKFLDSFGARTVGRHIG